MRFKPRIPLAAEHIPNKVVCCLAPTNSKSAVIDHGKKIIIPNVAMGAAIQNIGEAVIQNQVLRKTPFLEKISCVLVGILLGDMNV